jgi:EXS family
VVSACSYHQLHGRSLLRASNFRLQLWNALKYSTAFPVIALSAAKAAVRQSDWCGNISHHLKLRSLLWLKLDKPCSVP